MFPKSDERTIIGGDWNTRKLKTIPKNFIINYSRGKHWDLANHKREYTAKYWPIKIHYDHVFSNFGKPCTQCGKYYGTDSIKFGSVVGGFHFHPRADNGDPAVASGSCGHLTSLINS